MVVIFPLPWWEGVEGEGDKVKILKKYSPPPQPSPIKGEGVLAIFHATLNLGMIVLGAKVISVKLNSRPRCRGNADISLTLYKMLDINFKVCLAFIP